MEYWSDGVLEYWVMRIRNQLRCDHHFFFQYSSTPDARSALFKVTI